MKKIKFLTLSAPGLLVITLSLTGCTAIEKNAKPEVKAELLSTASAPEAKTIAETFVAGLSQAIQANDFDKFKAVIPPESKDKVTKEIFTQMVKELSNSLGELKKTEYLGVLNQSLVLDYIWKFSFEKKVSDQSGKQRNLGKEVLYMVRMGKVDGKFIIAGFGFRL